ncbi:hypothetical protein ACFE04_021983 [Oxalis oulophora]
MASKVVLITTFIFHVIAFALAVAAEQRRSTITSASISTIVVTSIKKGTVKQDQELTYMYCVYDSDIATGYGVGAFLFLMASQCIVMVASRCFCCGKALSHSSSRALAVILFIIVWVFFFIAEVCLLAGSVRNAYHTKYMTMFDDNPPSCETVRKGVFAAGAAFTFFTAVCSQFYYICYSKARESFNPYGIEAGVNMAAYK